MHLNITSLNKHHDDLNELLLTLPFSPKVICLSEVRLKNELSQNLNMHGYKFIHKPSPTIVGGVGMYISSTCSFEIIHKYNLNIQGCEDLWIELTVNKVKRLIGVIYRHPNNSNVEQFLSVLNDNLQELTLHNKHCYILGDLNLNTFGSVNNIGLKYLNMVKSYVCLSLITEPTRVTPTSATTIDHIISNEACYEVTPAVLQCKISDHHAVLCSISILDQQQSKKETQKYFDLKNFDKKKFCEDLQDSLNMHFVNIFSNIEMDLNSSFTKFLSVVRNVITKHAPIKIASRSQKQKQAKPWLTKGLLISIRRKQWLYKTQFLNGNSLGKDHFKMYSNTLNKLKQFSKKMYFHNEVETNKNNPKRMWNVLRTLLPNGKKQVSHEIPKLIYKGTQIEETNEIPEIFNSHFSIIGTLLANQINSNSQNYLRYLSNRTSSSMVLDPPTPNEIYNTIFTLKTKVNPDQDLPSFFLKIAAPILVPYLAIICYHSYQSGIFPDRMKIAKVIPIYKAGVTTDVNNYRPISALPCLSKVFEKLLLKRLNFFFERNDIIQPHQYGFRQKHSTVHALMHTVTRCYDAMNENFFSSLIMVDLRKAFDTVCHKKLLKKLDHYGIRGIVNELISNYLFNRKQYVYLNGVRSSLQPINIGVSQ